MIKSGKTNIINPASALAYSSPVTVRMTGATAPVRGADGEIQSIQFIAGDGSKRFMTGGRMAGGWCLLGIVTPDKPVLLAEGFATAASLHETTGSPVFCCFTAGNITAVAAMMMERYPNHARIICGDDDRSRADNPGRTKATAAAELTGAMLVFPKFQGQAGTDFNDMAQEAGAGAVRQLIDTALHGASKSTWFDLADWHATDRFQGEPPHREMLVSGVFPMGKPALVAAAGGVGKSFSLLQLAREVAAGSDDDLMRPVIFGGVLQAAGAAVLVTSEDDATEVHSRLSSMGAIPSRLYVVSLPDAGGVRPLFQADRAGVVSATPAWGELSRQLIAMKGLKLIVLDPLQPLAACNLNDAGAAQAVCSRLAALASETGAAVIISHHFSKARDIDTPAAAREAVRGSGALVDGVRCAYALWPMPMAKARATCTTLGRDYAPDCIVMGAVVKSNGKANRDVTTLLRNDSGLLIDMTAELRDKTPKAKDLLPALKAAIAGAAADGKPYTKSGMNGLYARRFELPEGFHAVGKHRLEYWADELLQSGEIVQAMCNGQSVKWLDIPGGEVANGTKEFVAGHVKRATAGRHHTNDEGGEYERL